MPREAKLTVAANDLAVAKAIKTEVDSQQEWKVEGVPGLSLVKKPSGVATYYVRFMVGAGAKRKSVREALGRANGPESIKLSDARKKAANRRVSGAEGREDDGSPKITLRQLFDQFEENNRDRAPRTMSDYREHLERDIFGPVKSDAEEAVARRVKSKVRLGDLPVAEVTERDIAKALTSIEARSPNAAHKCRAALGSLYKWASKRMLVEKNVVKELSFTYRTKRRDRVVNSEELRALWRAIEGPDFGSTPGMRIILKLAILTGQRNSEVAGARKSELKIGAAVANAHWHIPAVRMKRKDRDQYVFLSQQARALFDEALALAGDNDYVFPATTFGKHIEGEERTHIGQESVSRAMAKACELAGIEDLHLHDMRKAITTWLGDQGERSDVLDRILHHHSGHSTNQRSSVTETHYNFSVMAGPLRDAWQRWADHVDQVASDKPFSNVHQLARV